MKREYCCANCGLIWFEENTNVNKRVCPECSNNGMEDLPIFACDTFGWFYAHDSVAERLKEVGKEIHYAKDHPLYKEN